MRPSNTAIVFVGFQRDLFDRKGALTPKNECDSEAVLLAADRLIDSLSETVTSMFSAPIIFSEDYREISNAIGILKSIKDLGAFKMGSFGAEVMPEVSSKKSICTIQGRRGLNSFIGTDLQKKLIGRGIKNLVVAGATTSLCIDSTARAAHEKGYNVFILEDVTCARTQAEQSFYFESIFPLYSTILSSSELEDILKVGSR